MSVAEMFTQEFWDNRYGASERVWSGNPNPQLLACGSGLTPGSGLDVGCGEGADAIWLAARGWKVTGVDISPVGLERAAAHAAAASEAIAARIQWRHADLFADDVEPFGAFDLVSSHYLHLPPAVRDRAIGRLASAVLPGGSLLVVQHHPLDLEVPGLRPNMPELFCTAAELADLLDPAGWEIDAADTTRREVRRRDGELVTAHDALLHARRRD
jgi:SAM-dependent methyltransferase